MIRELTTSLALSLLSSSAFASAGLIFQDTLVNGTKQHQQNRSFKPTVPVQK